MKFDRKKFFDGFRDSIDETIKQEQVDGLEFLLGKIEKDSHWKDLRHIAYALATIYHETAGSMQPVEEGYYLGSKIRVQKFQKTLRYYPYFGRGYVQLTWETEDIPNYSKASEALGVDFVKNPDLVMEPENAYQIMTLGMHEGWFTGKKLSNYINDVQKDYKNARKIINGLDKAGLIAGYAKTFEEIIRASKVSAAPSDSSPQIIPNGETKNEEQLTATPAPPETKEISAEITPEGGVKLSSSEGPPAVKERIAVVKTKPKSWFSQVWAKITAAVTGNAFVQWIQAQLESIQALGIPAHVWWTIGIVIAIGSTVWIIYEIWQTYQENRHQKEIDDLLVKENSTDTNLIQLIPSNEVDLYRMRGFKIITRGETTEKVS